MIMDERLEFADGGGSPSGAVALAAGTHLIGSQIDLGAQARDPGNGEPMYLVITTDVEIITGGSAGTLIFALVSDSSAAIATDGSATEHLRTRSFVTDDSAANSPQLNAGGVIFMGPIPMEGAVYERYLGILAIVGTTTITAGSINAFLTRDPSSWRAYAQGDV